MAIYQVSYDLQKPEEHYEDLFEELDDFKRAQRIMDNAWLVRSSKTADEIYGQLEEHLFRKDKLLVIEVSNNYKGWLEDDAWHWIEDHLD
jgi:hypothetical protein